MKYLILELMSIIDELIIVYSSECAKVRTPFLL